MKKEKIFTSSLTGASRLPSPITSTSKSKRGKVYLVGFAMASLAGLVGCESTIFAPPPPVTAQMAAGKGKHVNVAALEAGRTLFVHRCIECHTLPPFWHYRAKDWPELVDSMAHRARLKPDECDAILAYILASRGQ